MRKRSYFTLVSSLLLMHSCTNNNQNDNVVSQRYVHKYGYAVSKDEFIDKQYPGQVVTLLKSGVTITSTYENGMLHGPCTHTFPYSQTVESYYLYNQGGLVKEIFYDITGMPMREEVKLSPTRHSSTVWYADGTPMCVEEYAGEELLEGQYFTVTNETEAKVEKGKGKRVRRDQKGTLLYRDDISEGYLVKRETFFPNGSPESIAFYMRGKLNGEKKIFTASGEPLSVMEYINGNLHGKSVLFKNGTKYLESHYLDGMKNGIETHFIDGDVVSREILWENDKLHGPSIFYIDGIAQTEYFYEGEAVGPSKWKELSHIDEMIGQISSKAQWQE